MRRLTYLIAHLLLLLIYTSSFAQAPIKKIDRLLYKDKVTEAESALKQMFAKDSASMQYYYYMGRICRITGHYKAAKEYCSKVLKMDSLSAVAIAEIGIIFAQTGDSIKALSMLNQAIAIDSTNGNFYNSRGSVYYIMNKYDLSILDLQKAAKIQPGNFRILYNIGNTYYQIDRYEDAIVYLSKALSGEKTRLAYFVRGLSYYYLDKYDEAIKDFNKGIGLEDTDNPYEKVSTGKLYYWRAQVYKTMGDNEKYTKDLDLSIKYGYFGE